MEQSLRREVWERASGQCEYCRISQQFDVLPFQIDHIIAAKHHGETVPQNLALSCFCCNVSKGTNIAGIDPKTRKRSRLFHPRRDAWEQHFRWSGAELLGRTSVGRTTIDVLNINLPDRVELRRLISQTHRLDG